MNPTLPRLRMDLDFTPSPVPDKPGLLIRDPFQYSEMTMIVPPPLVACLEYFDGEKTANDLRTALFEITGDLRVGELEEHLIESLRQSGFLEDETFLAMRAAREKEFADSPEREPTHAGSAYPGDAATLGHTMRRYLDGAASDTRECIAIAAPHVSPEGGWQSYRAAYGGLSRESYADRTFVVLGTSHYGAPERFGLSRKSWTTPWGNARPATALIDELAAAAPNSVAMEDYCMAVEHSIEFQVIFLQYLFGPEISILPVLCGSFAKSIYKSGMPEDDENVSRFLGTLGEIGAREGKRLFWVLGVDMAHMGRRYGDPFSAHAEVGEMSVVNGRDHARIERINAGDSRGYWDLVRDRHDDLKWCGSSPFYTFLKVMPQARGQLTRYEQWNIDPQSVVSFAGMKFQDG